MNDIDQYVHDVLHNIHASAAEGQRIEADLREHLQEATAVGQSPRAVIDHMGSATEVAAAFMSQVRLNHAGFWIRLLAFALDFLVMFALICVDCAMLALVDSIFPRNPQGLEWVLGAVLLFIIFGGALAMIGIGILYFPIQEGRFGQTLGKRWTGLFVLKENGMPIGYKEAFLRRLSFYFNFLMIDALFIPFTANKQRAFDIIARTIVVKQ